MIQFDESTHTYTVDGVILPSVTEITRFLSYDYKSDKPWLAKEAAGRGTRIHELCALMDYGEQIFVSPDLIGYIDAYHQFLIDYAPIWEKIEYPVGSLGLGYAGTLDRYGYMDGYTIMDIKTGVLHPAPLRAQLSGYDSLLSGLFPVDYLCALRLSRDGTYDFRRVPLDMDLFSACFTLYKATKKGWRQKT